MNFFKKIEKQTRTNLKHLEKRIRQNIDHLGGTTKTLGEISLKSACGGAGEALGDKIGKGVGYSAADKLFGKKSEKEQKEEIMENKSFYEMYENTEQEYLKNGKKRLEQLNKSTEKKLRQLNKSAIEINRKIHDIEFKQAADNVFNK